MLPHVTAYMISVAYPTSRLVIALIPIPTTNYALMVLTIEQQKLYIIHIHTYMCVYVGWSILL